MILIIGDSNSRDMIITNGERMSAAVGEEIQFKMVTNNESLKVELDGREDNPKIIIIGAPLNEIAFKVAKNQKRGRDETVRIVVEEMIKLIAKSAGEKTQCLHLVLPPFLRQEPRWIEEKLELCLFYQKKHIDSNSIWNLALGNPLLISADDLLEDNLHLTDSGKEKLYQIIESDILKCKANLGEEQEQIDWSSQVFTNPEVIATPTPGNIRKMAKRMRPEADDDDNSEKKAKIDTVIDKLTNIDVILQELVKDRLENKAIVGDLKQKVEDNSADMVTVKTKVEKMEELINNDNNLTAEMREDIDGLENENLKSTVIIRKLKAKEEVPKDKVKLRSHIQTVARKLVKDILDETASKDVRYAAPLYSFQDPKKQDNKAGLVPPFKVGFGSKETAIRFRDAAVKKAKEEKFGEDGEKLDNEYSNTYFTFFQSAGTRIRLMLMWAVADAIKTKTSEAWINQNTPKPTLQVKEGGKIIKTLSFVRTMNEYKDKIPKKTIEEATKIAKKTFGGQLEKTFIVIKD